MEQAAPPGRAVAGAQEQRPRHVRAQAPHGNAPSPGHPDGPPRTLDVEQQERQQALGLHPGEAPAAVGLAQLGAHVAGALQPHQGAGLAGGDPELVAGVGGHGLPGAAAPLVLGTAHDAQQRRHGPIQGLLQAHGGAQAPFQLEGVHRIEARGQGDHLGRQQAAGGSSARRRVASDGRRGRRLLGLGQRRLDRQPRERLGHHPLQGLARRETLPRHALGHLVGHGPGLADGRCAVETHTGLLRGLLRRLVRRLPCSGRCVLPGHLPAPPALLPDLVREPRRGHGTRPRDPTLLVLRRSHARQQAHLAPRQRIGHQRPLELRQPDQGAVHARQLLELAHRDPGPLARVVGEARVAETLQGIRREQPLGQRRQHPAQRPHRRRELRQPRLGHLRGPVPGVQGRPAGHGLGRRAAGQHTRRRRRPLGSARQSSTGRGRRLERGLLRRAVEHGRCLLGPGGSMDPRMTKVERNCNPPGAGTLPGRAALRRVGLRGWHPRRGFARRCCGGARPGPRSRRTPCPTRPEPGTCPSQVFFPLQVAIGPPRTQSDLAGRAFLLLEQRARQQSRGQYVDLALGRAVAVPTLQRPVRGARGWCRARVRPGVSRIHTGHRTIPGSALRGGARCRRGSNRKAFGDRRARSPESGCLGLEMSSSPLGVITAQPFPR